MKRKFILLPIALTALTPIIGLCGCNISGGGDKPEPTDLPTFYLDYYDTDSTLLGEIELSNGQQECRLVVNMNHWEHGYFPWSEGVFWFYDEEKDYSDITEFNVMKVTVDGTEINEGEEGAISPHWEHFDNYLHLENVTIKKNSVINVDINFKGVKKILANFSDES